MISSQEHLERQEDLAANELADQAAGKSADRLSGKLFRWFIQTALGLIICGVVWHFYDWGAWLFWGYATLACLSFATIWYLHISLAKRFSSFGGEIN